ncbi:MAG: hypothetical protein KC616_04505 [Myxococcales bacterium]|nr:hypothetical protein [Myxococcales bacterium]
MTRRSMILAALALIMAGLFAWIVHDSMRLVGEAFPGFMIWDNGMLLAFHGSDWTGIRAGLPTYGRILAVEGQPFVDRAALLAQVRAVPLGTPVEYALLVGGGARTLSVPTMRFELAGYLTTFGVYVFAAAVCWATTLAVLYLKRGAADARALAWMLFMVGLSLLLAVDLIGTSRFGRSLALAEPLTAVAILHFVAFFPAPRFRPGVLLGWLSVLYGVAALYGSVGAAYFYAAPEFSRRFNDFAYLGIALALVLAIAALGYSVLREASSDDRVRAAIVFTGALSACLVPAIAVPAFFLLGWSVSWSLVFAPVFLFPAAVLYAVARHDLFEAERFIRLSLGYGIASTLATLVFIFAVFALDITVFPDLKSSPAAALLFVLVLAIFFNPVLARTQQAIDRYFYRAAANPGRVLEELSADLAECSDGEGIRSRVEEILRAALNLEWVELDAAGSGGGAGLAPATGGVGLVRPVLFRSERLGELRCGPKLSGAPWAETDRDLVAGVAAQTGIALRNLRSLEDLRHAQESLVRQERLALMGELAGSVAHGVRNPLAGIRASAQIARQQTDHEDVRETVGGIIAESDRLERRVRALLDFSKPFRPGAARVDVGEVLGAVRSALEARARRAGMPIDVDVRGECVLPASDPDFLEEALLELAGNALRVMEPAGGRLGLSAAREAERIVVRVTDEGPGIPEDVRGRVFDLFFTTRPDGTGVGLATVKRIVEALAGAIRVEPREGGSGTTFVIELPATT